MEADDNTDLVLGSVIEMPGSPVPGQLKKFREKRKPSVLILKITLHE